MIKDYSIEDLSLILSSHYGINPNITQLGGYTDRNYLLTAPLSAKHILKISSTL